MAWAEFMAISCPTCGASANLEGTARQSGRFVRCAACGTQWLARALPVDPYRRDGERPTTRLAGDISEAIVIEDAPKVSRRPALPPPPRGRALLAPPPQASRGAALLPGLRFGGMVLAAIVGLSLLTAPLVAAWTGMNPAVAAAGGLEFRGIRSETVSIGNARTLVVEGEIVNTAARALDLPRVRVALTSSDGNRVTTWLVQPATARLEPGQSVGFRSARASPPTAATQVTLSLAE